MDSNHQTGPGPQIKEVKHGVMQNVSRWRDWAQTEIVSSGANSRRSRAWRRRCGQHCLMISRIPVV